MTTWTFLTSSSDHTRFVELPSMLSRRAELAANLTAVRKRIASAAAEVGRDPASVTLVVITKTWPASDVRILSELGIQHVGENRDQEAAPKAAELVDLPLCWHFVGQLQTNKVRSVAHYADVVESVDRHRLVGALDKAALAADRRITCLVQVALDDGDGRGGALPDEVPGLATAIEAAAGLELGGLMAVAPMDESPKAAFSRLQDVGERLVGAHPQARTVSAGMSGDLEAAIACGATHVRVGSAVLGDRPPVR